MTNDVAFEQSNTGANEESLRMVSASPVGNEPVSDEELRPHVLDGFIGQPRLKAQLQLFLDAARKRDVPPDHILLAGPPGLGKTTLAMIVANELGVPIRVTSGPAIQHAGDLASLLSSLDAGEVLFIDEIHTLVGAGKSSGAMDAANILKPALARGELRTIGATTLDEFQKYFEQDKALERRFQKVMVDEPTAEDAISILRGLKDRYENQHQVRIKDEAILAAVELSQRYITSRFLPDKAIDLIDEAASKLRLEMNSVPEEIDVLDRRVRQLEIEREAIRRENDKERAEQLTHEIE